MPQPRPLGPLFPSVLCRPAEWFVVFHQSCDVPLGRLFTIGQRFKHVSAFGYVEAVDGWLFYTWTWGQAEILCVPDEAANELLGMMSADSAIVAVIPPHAHFRRKFQAGFWCVPQVAHLTGVPSSALRPDAFFRDCLAHGGRIVSEAPHGQQTEARPGSEAPAGGGAGGQAGFDTG